MEQDLQLISSNRLFYSGADADTYTMFYNVQNFPAVRMTNFTQEDND